MTAGGPVRFVPSSAVRHADVDGLRVLLDLNTETYRVLDDAASALWPVLIGDTGARGSLEEIIRRYDVDGERLRAELAAFAARCVAEGLLEYEHAPVQAPAAAAPSARARPRRAGTLQALMCFIATRRALRRDGFRATYERYAHMPAGPDSPPVRKALAAFARAENFFVARRAPEDCLLRSLSLYRFLRSVHVPAEHVIGVRRFPFTAHAWVECAGAAVFEDHAGEYTPLARIGAL